MEEDQHSLIANKGHEGYDNVQVQIIILPKILHHFFHSNTISSTCLSNSKMQENLGWTSQQNKSREYVVTTFEARYIIHYS